MSSNTFAIVSFATAMLKMKTLDCHGVTVGHQEREEEEVEQEVESDGEKTLKERCACPWMG